MMKYKVTCNNPTKLSLVLNESSSKSPGNFYSTFTSTFSDQLNNSVARDLVAIGQGIFLSDRSFKRDSRIGNKTRELVLELPVENEALWNKVKWRIEDWAKFVSHDVWRIRFVQAKQGKKLKAEQVDSFKKTPVVCLFSDGLDSLCGALYALKAKDEPIFVSHTPPGFQTAQDTIEKLKEKFNLSDSPTHHATFRFLARDIDPKSGKRNMMTEYSRRTRPVLYLSLAGAVALETGASEVRLNENGWMAINLPTAFQKSGSDISRHAHPEMLRIFEGLLNAIAPTGRKIIVNNPFDNLTKGEEVTSLVSVPDLVSNTMSCAYGRRQMARIRNFSAKKNTKALKECGLCIPCLVRRAAVFKAGISEDVMHYAYSLTDSSRSTGSTKKKPLLGIIQGNVEELTAFSNRIKKMSKREFALTYIYELSLLAPEPKKVESVIKNAYDINQRFATEFLAFQRKSS